MTYQPPHIIIYNDNEYDLRGDSSEGLPMFDLLGIRPRGGTTAGNYFASYTVRANILYLDNLEFTYHFLESEKVENITAINSIKPTYEDGFLRYEDVIHHMPITGKITIARKPLWELPEDVNWLIDYELVLRLTVSKGFVTWIEDFSHHIDALRSKHNDIKQERAEIWRKKGIPLRSVMFDGHRQDEILAIYAEVQNIIGKDTSTFFSD